MRSFKDADGKIAWVYDEQSHPQGNHKGVDHKTEVHKEETPKHSIFKKK